jgi:hypothetical protein
VLQPPQLKTLAWMSTQAPPQQAPPPSNCAPQAAASQPPVEPPEEVDVPLLPEPPVVPGDVPPVELPVVEAPVLARPVLEAPVVPAPLDPLALVAWPPEELDPAPVLVLPPLDAIPVEPPPAGPVVPELDEEVGDPHAQKQRAAATIQCCFITRTSPVRPSPAAFSEPPATWPPRCRQRARGRMPRLRAGAAT